MISHIVCACGRGSGGQKTRTYRMRQRENLIYRRNRARFGVLHMFNVSFTLLYSELYSVWHVVGISIQSILFYQMYYIDGFYAILK